MHKGLKYALIVAAIGLVGYNSVYIKKLSEVRASGTQEFDAVSYANNFLKKTLPEHKDEALDLAELIKTLTGNPRKAFALSHAQNNGNARFFMVKGSGEITKLDEDNAYLKVEGVSKKVLLATEYIIGNAARDGSGLISVDEFTTTMEMNTVSEEINKQIRAEVLPPFKERAKVGDKVEFTGSIELNQTRLLPDSLEVIPLILHLNK